MVCPLKRILGLAGRMKSFARQAAARMNATSLAMTESAVCSPSARKKTFKEVTGDVIAPGTLLGSGEDTYRLFARKSSLKS